MTDQQQWQFLDNPTGAEALAWVENHNSRALEQLETDRYREIRNDVLSVLEDGRRIPHVRIRDQWAYNFWTDENNPRGLWRRQLASSYLATDKEANNTWETLIDVDALAQSENRSWVWGGAAVCYPNNTRALISLSDGGSDSTIVREFDIHTRQFVPGGFTLPESKGAATWIDEDTLWVSRDFGPNTLTNSGYPRQVRRWSRGMSLAQAPIIFEGEQTDVLVMAVHDPTPGWERDVAVRVIDFHHEETFVINEDDSYTKIECPTFVHASVWRDWLLFLPKEDWQIGHITHPAGSLVAAPFDSYMAGKRHTIELFTPTNSTSLENVTPTRHHLVLTVLDNVASRVEILTAPPASPSDWERTDLQLTMPGATDIMPPFASLHSAAFNALEDDRLWLTTTSFTSPTTLSLVELSPSGQVISARIVRDLPAMFNSRELVVTQHFATSDDGTRIPYFQVGHRNQTHACPTLLYGYGGFEVSLTPTYLATAGRAWLERGGVYVVANIRGGGEYGPDWHRAALKDQRPRAYEDFAAVARDLVRRGVTTHHQLAAQGGSNGGLLVGMMLTRYPDLFGALVCQVPLLDMRRYHTLLAGASWMAEYGNPDNPTEWEYIKEFSPFHLFTAHTHYPPVLFTTSTRDDRVHPAHARTMVAQMDEAGKDVLFYENTEGGHAGAADHQQRATMAALAWEFLWQKLGTPPATES